MIRDVFIAKKGGVLLFYENINPNRNKNFKDMSKDLISGFLQAVIAFAKEVGSKNVESIVMYDLKFVYGHFGQITIIFCVDKYDSTKKINKKIHRVAEAFLLKYHEPLNDENMEGVVTIYADFSEDLDLAIKSTIKIIFLGESGVGKTTIFKFLKGDRVPVTHIPTLGPEINEIKIAGDVQIVVWDSPGQKLFHLTWTQLIRGADIVFLVTDSSAGNVDETKALYEKFISQSESDTRWYCIANKQDLSGALTPERVEKLLGVPTHGLVAIDDSTKNWWYFENILREKIGEIIGENVTEMNLKEEGEDDIPLIVEQLEHLKESALQLFDISNNFYAKINFWIDKLKNYPYPKISDDDLKEFILTKKEWLEQIQLKVREPGEDREFTSIK